MGRPAFAQVEDLERLLGQDIGTSALRDQAEARLEQASELVRAFADADWLNDDETAVEGLPGAIPGVVAGIVERASRNPEGAVQESQTTGPFSVSRSFGADAAARLYLTKGDKLVIRRSVGVGGIGVISTTRGQIETSSVTCDWGYVEADDPYRLWP